MLLKEVIELLEAEKIFCPDENTEVLTACGSDMMSDALAFVKDHAMLLTGLLNPQSIRTAEMLDMRCVVYVRGKMPTQEIINLAKEKNIALLSTRFRMFTACGKLYAAGLSGGCE